MKTPPQTRRLEKKRFKLESELKASIEARGRILADHLRAYTHKIDLFNEPQTLEFLALTEYELQTQFTNMRNDIYLRLLAARKIKAKLDKA